MVLHLKRLARLYPDSQLPRMEGEGRISARLLGRKVTACTLGQLPPLMQAPLLLDVDLDFLVIPEVSYRKKDSHPELPWCWPEEMVESLNKKNIRPAVITISRSVEGGYTPLRWRHFAEELQDRFQKKQSSLVMAAEYLRRSALFATERKLAEAERMCFAALQREAGFAAPSFHLAEILYLQGRLQEARARYRDAIAKDPAYRMRWKSAGVLAQLQNDWSRMESECARARALDPEDPYACLGLAQITLRRRQWQEAEEWLKTALRIDSSLTDAHRLMGDLLMETRRLNEASEAYRTSLKLALAGAAPLNSPISSFYKRPVDRGHFQVCAKLGRLYAKEGRLHDAISAYRLAVAGGTPCLRTRLHLGWLTFCQRPWGAPIYKLFCAVRGWLKNFTAP